MTRQLATIFAVLPVLFAVACWDFNGEYGRCADPGGRCESEEVADSGTPDAGSGDPGTPDAGTDGGLSDSGMPMDADAGCVELTCESGKWCTVEQAPANLQRVRGSGPNNVWAVGNRGVIVHWDGCRIRRYDQDIGEGVLTSVWVPDEGDVVITGSRGNSVSGFEAVFIRVKPDGGVVTQATASERVINNVWGSSPSDVWATTVGKTSRLWHSGGDLFLAQSDLPPEMNCELLGIWGTASDDIWAGSRCGKLFHYDGSAWRTATSPFTQEVWNLWGYGPGEYYAAGEAQRGVIENDEWTAITSLPAGIYYDVHGSNPIEDVWFSNHKGEVFRKNGAGWDKETVGAGAVFSVYSSGSGDVWIVSETLLRRRAP